MRRMLAFLAAGAGALAGCDHAPPAVPLDEARRVAVEREAPQAVPRSIDDIAAILRHSETNPAARAANRTKADAEPPAGLAGEKLGDFHLARARAARAIGRLAQELADGRRAVELYEAAGVDSSRALQVLSQAEQKAGNLRRAVELHRRRLETFAGTPAALGDMAALASVAAITGDVEEAKRRADDSDRLYGELQRRPARGRPDWANFHLEFLNALAQGRYRMAAGHPAEAEAAFRRAEQAERRAAERRGDAERGDQLGKTDLLLAHAAAKRILATFYTRQGRPLEAEAEARGALIETLQTTGAASPDVVDSIRVLAAVLLEEGRFGDAEKLSAEGIRLAEGTGIEPTGLSFAGVRLLLSDTLVLQGRDREALDIYDSILEAARHDETTRRWTLRDRTNTILAMYRTGRTVEGYEMARTIERRHVELFGPDAPMTAEAGALAALGAAARGDRVGALATLRRAVPILLKGQGVESADEESGGSATARAQRLRFILESYVDLLADSDAPDAAAEAFRAADAARLNAVHRAIAAAAARSAVDDPDLADLVRQEQDVAARLSAGWSGLAAAAGLPAEQRDDTALTALRTEIGRLAQARVTLRDAIAARSPSYAALTQPTPAELGDVRRRLARDEAMVMIMEGRRRSYVWAFRSEGPVAFRAVPATSEQLREAVAELRRPMEASIATLDDVLTFDVAAAHRLYAALLQPVEAGWRPAGAFPGTLIVVPDTQLAALPFGLLLTEPATSVGDRDGEVLFSGYRRLPWLIRGTAVAQSPSAASFVSLRSTRPAAAGRQPFVGFGDPVFAGAREVAAADAVPAPQTAEMRGVSRRAAPATATKLTARLGNLPRLPDTADEVREVATALKADSAAIFLGPAASEERLRAMRLDDRRVVMFATHGLRPGDLDGLMEPALALSAAAPGGAAGDDGLLTASEILRLRLNADWVILSACNTGAASGAGAEALSGLARAFFYAGSRAVLATNWPVETTSARALTVGLFREQAAHPEISRARALRAAALAAIDGGLVDRKTGKALFSYAHPLFWAPFSLVGDGGI